MLCTQSRDVSGLAPCTHEEADTRILFYLKDAVPASHVIAVPARHIIACQVIVVTARQVIAVPACHVIAVPACQVIAVPACQVTAVPSSCHCCTSMSSHCCTSMSCHCCTSMSCHSWTVSVQRKHFLQCHPQRVTLASGQIRFKEIASCLAEMAVELIRTATVFVSNSVLHRLSNAATSNYTAMN